MKPKGYEFHLIYSVTDVRNWKFTGSLHLDVEKMGRLKGNLDLFGKLVKMVTAATFLK